MALASCGAVKRALPLVLVGLAACRAGDIGVWDDHATAEPDAASKPHPDAGGPRPDAGGTGGDGGGSGDDGIVNVTRFPFYDTRDSSLEPRGILDLYACDPEADESGPDVI